MVERLVFHDRGGTISDDQAGNPVLRHKGARRRLIVLLIFLGWTYYVFILPGFSIRTSDIPGGRFDPYLRRQLLWLWCYKNPAVQGRLECIGQQQPGGTLDFQLNDEQLQLKKA